MHNASTTNDLIVYHLHVRDGGYDWIGDTPDKKDVLVEIDRGKVLLSLNEKTELARPLKVTYEEKAELKIFLEAKSVMRLIDEVHATRQLDIELGTKSKLVHVQMCSDADRKTRVIDATHQEYASEYIKRALHVRFVDAKISASYGLYGMEAISDVASLIVARKSENVSLVPTQLHCSDQTTMTEKEKVIAYDEAKVRVETCVQIEQKLHNVDAKSHILAVEMSPTISIDIVPKLEIFSSDVQCSHGATSGPIDQAACEYLMTRGMSETQAREMVLHGFAHELLEGIDDARLSAYLARKLKDIFSHKLHA